MECGKKGGGVNRMFIVVEGKCYVPNKDTGDCSCPNDPNRLKQIEVSRYRGNECNNGGSNCREPDRRLYTCNYVISGIAISLFSWSGYDNFLFG